MNYEGSRETKLQVLETKIEQLEIILHYQGQRFQG